ncbi:MAG: hypothetical protein ABIR11_07980, partial [Candidatus Limnocylindrales bacterium]
MTDAEAANAADITAPGDDPGPPRRDGATADAAPTVVPYGSWASPIEIGLLTGGVVGLAEPRLDGDDIYWMESRAAEGGRRTLLRRSLDGATRELTPLPFKVGNRVHEYGGGSYVVGDGRVVASSTADGRLWRIDPDGLSEPVAITPDGPYRYADMRFHPRAERLYAVRETHDVERDRDPALVVNEIVVIALDGTDGPGRALCTGPDFVAAPRPSPDGRRLAWLEWDHPDMPWDSVRLRVADVTDDGTMANPRTLAGGTGISIVQPAWRADGVLFFVSDET